MTANIAGMIIGGIVGLLVLSPAIQGGIEQIRANRTRRH